MDNLCKRIIFLIIICDYYTQYFFIINCRFVKHTDKPKKLGLRTFFGNPDVKIFSIRFDPEDLFIASGVS